MTRAMQPGTVLDQGVISFSIEGRVLRELGERLVKTPEVAVVELIKNAYDADATECSISHEPNALIEVRDDGLGMTLEQFRHSWMRIGTGAKASQRQSIRYQRLITGEKGIGRFAVRFLGRRLTLVSVAHDNSLGFRTRLVAQFDWPQFDYQEDLGNVDVPYSLEAVGDFTSTGTTLQVSELRSAAQGLRFDTIRSGSIGILSPLRSLFYEEAVARKGAKHSEDEVDPGFMLAIDDGSQDLRQLDVASQVLNAFVLRAKLTLRANSLDIKIYQKGRRKPYLRIKDTYRNGIGLVKADIRFFPRRTGTFTQMPLDGRKAQKWISDNHGVAVFDRGFRVPPYGTAGDDWLHIQSDVARNRRAPRSHLAEKHFPMSASERADPAINWMLKLPKAQQLVGLVQVRGRRSSGEDGRQDDVGLIASADRQGFLANESYNELEELIRGAVEALAFADRKIQLEEEERERRQLTDEIRRKTGEAIAQLEADPEVPPDVKRRLLAAMVETQRLSQAEQDITRERARRLEVMSLLGVVAGYMTHEFGSALTDLEEAAGFVSQLAQRHSDWQGISKGLQGRIEHLREFSSYSTAYVRGARNRPKKAYTARPRLRQVRRIFGSYAFERNIEVALRVERDVLAPRVPVSLYNGIALNLYTNALKAVTVKSGSDDGQIVFAAWNEGKWHILEVSDTGIGVPSILHERVFEPLFTTTDTDQPNDPLGSGLGLGLSFVRRSVEAYGGKIDFQPPTAPFSTTVRVRLPHDAPEE